MKIALGLGEVESEVERMLAAGNNSVDCTCGLSVWTLLKRCLQPGAQYALVRTPYGNSRLHYEEGADDRKVYVFSNRGDVEVISMDQQMKMLSL